MIKEFELAQSTRDDQDEVHEAERNEEMQLMMARLEEYALHLEAAV